MVKKVYGNPKIMEEDSIEVEEIRSLLELLNYLNLDIGFEDILINRRKIENDVELNQGDEVSIKAKKI